MSQADIIEFMNFIFDLFFYIGFTLASFFSNV